MVEDDVHPVRDLEILVPPADVVRRAGRSSHALLSADPNVTNVLTRARSSGRTAFEQSASYATTVPCECAITAMRSHSRLSMRKWIAVATLPRTCTAWM